MGRIIFAYSLSLLISFYSTFTCSAVGEYLPESSGHYRFIENKGQWPSQVLFRVDLESGWMYIEKNAITFDLRDGKAMDEIHDRHTSKEVTDWLPVRIKGHSYRVEFEGASENPLVKMFGELPGKYNWFIGKDPSKWGSGCGAWKGIRLESIYPGIDLHVYSKDFQLKYDFVVHPGADPSLIQMRYTGQDEIRLENKRLLITTSVGEIREQKPIAWNEGILGSTYVECSFELNENRLEFNLPSYNRELPLVIDPELIFSTYSGSMSNNFGYTATYDSEGYLYSGSSAFGASYPVVPGSYELIYQGGLVDIALSKFDVSGTFLVYSTFLGGSSDELPHSLIVNSAGELFVYGTASSLDFPTTEGCYDQTFNGGSGLNLLNGLGVNYINGSDIIVSRLSADGSQLLASTYVGGSGNDGLNTGSPLKYNYADEIRGEILIDDQNNIYIASSTQSSNFPVTPGAFQTISGGGGQEGCVFQMDNSLSSLVWSSFLGGSDDDAVYAVDIDSNGDVIVCGGTQSTNFPTTFGAVQLAYGGGTADGFIVKIVQSGSVVEFSSFWGSSAYDQIYFVELDDEDRVHVFGQTTAPGNTYIINAAYGTPGSGQFITKFSPSVNAVVWSTAFGTGNGTPNISPTAFLVDVCDKIYLSGWGSGIQGSALTTQGLEVTPGAYQTTTDGDDFYLLVIESDGSDIFYGSYFGGPVSREHVDGGTSRFDRKGVIYQAVCAGCGGNSDFPIYPNPGAVSPTNNSSCNLGVFKFDFQLPITVADFTAPSAICIPAEIDFTNTSIGGLTYQWDFGDGSTSTAFSPSHIYEEPGVYEITLVATNPATCNESDTLSKQIVVLSNSTGSIAEIELCPGESEQIGITPSADPTITYQWIPEQFLTDPNSSNPICSSPFSLEYQLLISNGVCVDTLLQEVNVTQIGLTIPSDTLLCGENVLLELIAGTGSPETNVIWSYSSDFSEPINENPQDYSIEISVNEPLTLFIQAELEGCVETATMEVEFTSSSTEIGGDFIACPGDTVDLNILNPSPELEYIWLPENLIISGQSSPSVLVAPQQETTFYVSSTYAEGCTVTDSVTVSVSTLNGNAIMASANPTLILEGESSQLGILPEGYNYTWYPPASLNDANTQNPLASPSETTTYYVSISDGDCVYIDSVTVRVSDFICGDPSLYIPNAFTPNDDDRNNTLFVRGNFITAMHLRIYNRWGEKVFETREQQVGWDGTYKGKPADPSVFVYYLEVTCDGGVTWFEKGNITLIR